MSCGLIVEEDEDFGSVVELPMKSESRDDKHALNLDPEQIRHLTATQQKQFLEVLNKYYDRFSEKPGLCTLVEHEIELKPEYREKEFMACRIPLIYRAEVERQIKEMLHATLLNRHRVEWQVHW